MAKEDLEIRIGSPAGLLFSIRWDGRISRGSADEVTRGWLDSAIAGTAVWSEGSGESEPSQPWSLIEMLEHLSWAWPYLELEEIDPLGMGVRPDLSRAEADRRWEDSAKSVRVEEQKQLLAYEECHDLSRAFQGMWLPSLWVQREGAECWLISPPLVERRPFKEVKSALEALGNTITARIERLDDERAQLARRNWNNRSHLPIDQQLAIAVGLDVASLKKAAGKQTLARVFEYKGDYEQGELLVAARMMAGAIGPQDMGKLLDRLRGIKASKQHEADRLGEEARNEMATVAGLPAHDQGFRLARWLRSEKLSLRDEQMFDPKEFLQKKLKVKLSRLKMESSLLDAVCVWGPRHGPAILVNTEGKHSQGKAGERATLAHEICHVLLDRHGALPFAEVLGGRVSRSIEARARAFAAEMLIPKYVAGKTFAEVDEPQRAMNRLRNRHKASAEIIAWQAHNSDVSLPPKARKFLHDRVSMPKRFSL
jgi:Zn-dependent peptidase ImmA (M78 family)